MKMIGKTLITVDIDPIEFIVNLIGNIEVSIEKNQYIKYLRISGPHGDIFEYQGIITEYEYNYYNHLKCVLNYMILEKNKKIS